MATELDKVFKDAQAKAADIANEMKVAFAKEKDALDYELSILRRNEMDALETEKKKKVSDLDEYIYAKKKELAAETEALEVKSAEVMKKVADLERVPELEDEIVDLKKSLSDQHAKLATAMKDNEYQAKIKHIEYSGSINAKNAIIESLEEKVETLTEANASLEAKLEAAYSRITDMANNTANSASKDATISALKDVAAQSKVTVK
jgi:chromosome segregation ATPase